MRIGINGFGRMGRLALRAGWGRAGLELVAVNEPHGSAETLATLLEFDSIHRRFGHAVEARGEELLVGGKEMRLTRCEAPSAIPWRELGVDCVLECSGKWKTREKLAPHFAQGARKIVVSAPVKDGVPNLVVGVNDQSIDFAAEPIVTAASCTTNCLAPVLRVLHDGLGIVRASVTTIHDPTNTQRVLDAPHEDPRRARATQLNLIPTSTGSATAVALILPELAGKLHSLAVRAPVMNASLVDAVVQVARPTTREEVNALFARAAETPPLLGILGYETRPLVSSDFAGDPRSAIVDAGCTHVTDGVLVKVLAWYDNEWGYANRLVDLLARYAAVLDGARG
jgi:glyceraldehyde 3-phosphate dehydrogenase